MACRREKISDLNFRADQCELSTKNGPFHISDGQEDNFKTKLTDTFAAPSYFLKLFGGRLFFEKHDDILEHGRSLETYQIVLLKAKDQRAKKGFVQLGGEDSQSIEPLSTTEKTKSYGLLGQSTPLNIGGRLLVDKMSGLPTRIEILGTFAIISPTGPATADLSFLMGVSKIGQNEPLKKPVVRALRQERKKIPSNAKKLLADLK